MWLWIKKYGLPVLFGSAITWVVVTGSEIQRWKYSGLTAADEQRLTRLIREEIHVVNQRIDRLMELVLDIRADQQN